MKMVQNSHQDIQTVKPDQAKEKNIMEFMLDTADTKAIKDLDTLLSIDGVTTNPTIITKSGKDPEQAIADIISILRPEQKMFVQVVSTDYDGIMAEARKISALRPENMYVKIPVTRAGLMAIKQCAKEGIHTLATAIYSAAEGYLAAANGADYLAPYVNRICNYTNGVAEVVRLLNMLSANNMKARVIAASFKNANQVNELIENGIQAVTVAPDVVTQMYNHPATELAVEEFTENWDKAYGRKTLFGE